MSAVKNTNEIVVELEFSKPQIEIVHSRAGINLFHGGVGSGKTFLIGFRQAYFAKNYPFVRGFIGANTYEQLNKSTLVGVFKFWAMLGLKRDIDYVVDCQPPEHFKVYGERLKSYKNTISFKTGRLVFLSSLNNYEAIDGIEFCDGDLDETKDTEEEAVKEVVLARQRQTGLWLDERGNIITDEKIAIENNYKGYNPLNLYTSPAKTPWLSDWFEFPKYHEEISASIFSETDYFRKRIGNKLVVISSTYHNLANLPKGYIEEKLIEPNAHNQHRIDMLVYGSPLAKSGNEYYNQFERLKHVKDVEMPDNVPIHFSFDFNRGPYITLLCYKAWMSEDKWRVHQFDEICLPPPHNTTEHLCRRAIELYGHLLHNGVFIYGDYSGKNKRTNSNEHDYDVIFRVFKKFIGSYSDKSLSERIIKNQSVKVRKEFMNKIFYGSLPIIFTIAPRCSNTIKDCEFLMEAPDGGKVKAKDKDGNEKLGHCSDAQEYFFTSIFNQYFKL